VARTENELIASTYLYGQRPGEARFKISVEIGRPYQGEGGEWRCPVALRPFPAFPDVAGEDSLQALCLAISLVRETLEFFRDDGGLLAYETGEAFALDSYSLGVARTDYGRDTKPGQGSG
jgi:hypothetical protein